MNYSLDSENTKSCLKYTLRANILPTDLNVRPITG